MILVGPLGRLNKLSRLPEQHVDAQLLQEIDKLVFDKHFGQGRLPDPLMRGPKHH